MVLLVLVLIGTGTVYASNPALPGDILYPVKLEVEQIQFSIIPKDAQVNMGIQLMQKRNQEIDRLIELERYNDMNPALQSLEYLSGDAVQNYGNLDSQQHPDANQQGKNLDTAIENNITVLSRVYTMVPPQAQDAIGHAIDMSKKDSSSIEEKLKGHGHKNGSQNGSSIQPPTPTSPPDPSNVKKHPGNQPSQSNGNPGSTKAPGQGNNPGGAGGKPPHSVPHSKP
jgi:hypothetical protein